MNELALFSGGGGGLLATKWLLGWRAVCYVEKDPHCQNVIRARIKDGWLDDAPIWDDARTFDGRPWRGVVDCITAGFPCQPFSGAGKLAGQNDASNLWPDTIRIIREVQPEWCLLENVPRLLTFSYFGRILGDLAESGFDIAWDCLPASAVGAPHQRDRLWIVAHAGGRTIWEQHLHATTWPNGQEQDVDLADSESRRERVLAVERKPHKEDADTYWRRENVADTHSQRSQRRKQKSVRRPQGIRPQLTNDGSEVSNANGEGQSQHQPGEQREISGRPDVRRVRWWDSEPGVGRVAHGVARRVVRIRAIGNGQVPEVVAQAWGILHKRLVY